MSALCALREEIARAPRRVRVGRVAAVAGGWITITGVAGRARIGDMLRIDSPRGPVGAEVVALEPEGARALVHDGGAGVGLGAEARLLGARPPRPGPSWIGRVVDAFGEPMDGRALLSEGAAAELDATPPDPASRKGLGTRLATGVSALDTMLPLVRGQRLGVFAGSGVGKTLLLTDLARGVEADVVVVGLIGERGRELNAFLADGLGREGLERAVVVAATSDQSALVRRRAAMTAMAAAEAFRREGRQVLLLLDSLTRLAEAHREIALAAGEPPSLRAYPPSTAGVLARFAERAGPGAKGEGDITAVFTVLAAGSDMEEPVADMTRGILDGHIVLSREIAERGRFPAIDVRRSASRSLPKAATAAENAMIARARKLLGAYEDALPMIQTGLYAQGSDQTLDMAVNVFPALDAFFASAAPRGVADSFRRLEGALMGRTRF